MLTTCDTYRKRLMAKTYVEVCSIHHFPKKGKNMYLSVANLDTLRKPCLGFALVKDDPETKPGLWTKKIVYSGAIIGQKSEHRGDKYEKRTDNKKKLKLLTETHANVGIFLNYV